MSRLGGRLGGIRIVVAPRRAQLVLALLVSAAAAPPAGLAVPVPAASAAWTVRLGGEVLPGLAAVRDLGPVAATRRMSIAVSVSGRDAAGMGAAYRAIYTPGSPAYHRFLTPAQIARRFGTPPARWRAVRSWLTGGGMRIAYASGTRDLLLVAGSAGDVERLFGVQLREYRSARARFVANAGPPAVPPALGILHVLGLNTFERMVPHAPARTVTGGARGLAAVTGQNIGTQTPQEVAAAYDAPPAWQGAGQSVAMLGAGQSATILTDLTAFEHAYGLPAVPVSVQQVGPGPFTDTSNNTEWDLDTQAEVGMAPQASSLKMYFATDLTDASVAALFSAWESDPNAPLQADASFGSCETNPIGSPVRSLLGSLASQINNLPYGTSLLDDLQATTDPVLLQATLQGKTLFAGAGDTGSSCPALILPSIGAGNGVLNQLVPFTSYPASSPYVVAAGGTVLYTSGSGTGATRSEEYAWTFGGGGDTLFIDKPSYQQGVPNIGLPCLSTPAGQPTNLGGPCRGVPDVSAMSGDAITNGYAIIANGQASEGGGTSLSGPLLAGLWTRIQGASPASGGNGFANERFYAIGKSPSYGRDFFDVTTGLLGIPEIGNGLYLTGTGWDYATGLGVPDIANMIADIDGR